MPIIEEKFYSIYNVVPNVVPMDIISIGWIVIFAGVTGAFVLLTNRIGLGISGLVFVTGVMIVVWGSRRASKSRRRKKG